MCHIRSVDREVWLNFGDARNCLTKGASLPLASTSFESVLAHWSIIIVMQKSKPDSSHYQLKLAHTKGVIYHFVRQL